jgi:hypothetical protein
MMRKQFAIPLLVAVALLAGLLVAISGGGALAAPIEPLMAPTPVAVTQPVRTQPELYTLFPTAVLTQDTRGTCRELGMFSVADIQVVIDMSDTNTTTGYLQFSNDLAAYINGTNVVSAAAEDTTDMVQTPLFGRYACWYTDVTTDTAPITITVSAWVK